MSEPFGGPGVMFVTAEPPPAPVEPPRIVTDTPPPADAPPADAPLADAPPADAKAEAVRLAYQLLLGRDPENDDIVNAQSTFADIYDLRNRFMSGDEFQLNERFLRAAELIFPHQEAQFKADTERFDAFLTLEPEVEARVREIIRLEAAASEYTTFHTSRFFDQVRAVAAIRKKLLGAVTRPRVLEVGASPVTRMYAQIVNDIDLHTADLPAAEPPEVIGRRFGSTEHYYINLDVDALTERHPRLVEQPFNVVLFCEVIEHVLASPEEMISDLLKLLAPGGILIVTTPNALSSRRLYDIVLGRKGDSIYRRNQKEMHQHHHIHVREYTPRELREAVAACGAKVLLHAVKNYYGDTRRDFVATRYVCAGEVQVLFIAKPPPGR